MYQFWNQHTHAKVLKVQSPDCADESRMSMTGEAFLSRPHCPNEREFKTKLRRTPRAVCVRPELEIGVILAGYSPETALNVPNGGILASISPETTVLTLKTQIVYLDDIVTQLFAQHSFVWADDALGAVLAISVRMNSVIKYFFVILLKRTV